MSDCICVSVVVIVSAVPCFGCESCDSRRLCPGGSGGLGGWLGKARQGRMRGRGRNTRANATLTHFLRTLLLFIPPPSLPNPPRSKVPPPRNRITPRGMWSTRVFSLTTVHPPRSLTFDSSPPPPRRASLSPSRQGTYQGGEGGIRCSWMLLLPSPRDSEGGIGGGIWRGRPQQGTNRETAELNR